MDNAQKTELLQIAGRQIGFDFPMSQRTTFRVGGNAEAVYEANDPEGLLQVVSFLALKKRYPAWWQGRGSNLLVGDGGIRGVVVFLAGDFADIQFEESDYPDISAGAGLSISDLMIWCREKGLSGLEFLAGIPGSVGGAVAMNAGAFGEETGSRVREIRLVTRRGQLAVRDRSRLRFSYRASNLEAGVVITDVLFRLDWDTPKNVSDRIAACLKRRKETQPLEYPSAGSIFKNPPNDYAGRLMEQAGLKGKRIGGAMISNKHANFIVNMDDATAKDIITLINLAREEVRRTAGVQLKLEVQIVGGA